MNIEKLTPIFNKYKAIFIEHSLTIVTVTILCVFGFVVVRIYALSIAEPTEIQIEEKLSDFKLVRLDPEVVSLFRSLEDQNISIESLFDNGRTNPFQD